MTPAPDDGRRPSSARRCGWCGVVGIRDDARFCSKKCRQTAFRLRRRSGWATSLVDGATSLTTSATFAYADPPYPGLSRKYYSRESTYAGEVDHHRLIASLIDRATAGELAGWALSTSAAALRDVLPLCPPAARVCPWVKPIGVSSKTYGLHNTWEVVIVVGGRPARPGVRDWLRAMPARGGGTLMGRKPIAFCAWLFDLLGMQPGDRLIDLFPGTGAVSKAWRELETVSRPRTTAVAAAGGAR